MSPLAGRWHAVAPQSGLVAATGLVALAIVGRPTGTVVAFVLGVTLVVALVAVPDHRAAALAAFILTAIVVLVPIGPAEGLLRWGRLPGTSVLSAAALCLVALVLLRVRPAMPPGPVVLAALGFGTFLVVATVAHGGDLRALADHWLLWLSAFVLGLTIRPGDHMLVRGWVVLGLGVAAYAIAEHALNARTLYSDALLAGYRSSVALAPGVEEFRSQATFGHPVPLGAYLAVTFALLAWGPARRTSSRAVRPIAICAVTFAIATTFARSSWLSLASATVIGLLLQRLTARRRVQPLLLVGAVISALVLSPLGGNVIRYLEGSSTTAGYQARLANLRSVEGVFSSGYVPMLTGRGGGAAEAFIERAEAGDADQARTVDNQFVTVLIESGLLGLAALLALIWLVVRNALRQLRRPTEATPVDELQGLLIAVTALVVGMLFFELLYWPSTSFVFWCVIGMLCRPAPDPASAIQGDPTPAGVT